jgi:hypothetical protein
VATEKDAARYTFAQNSDRVAQTGAIAFGIARKWRAGSPLLAEGQIAAQDSIAMFSESFAERHE